jgi:hypothetical protein
MVDNMKFILSVRQFLIFRQLAPLALLLALIPAFAQEKTTALLLIRQDGRMLSITRDVETISKNASLAGDAPRLWYRVNGERMAWTGRAIMFHPEGWTINDVLVWGNTYAIEWEGLPASNAAYYGFRLPATEAGLLALIALQKNPSPVVRANWRKVPAQTKSTPR